MEARAVSFSRGTPEFFGARIARLKTRRLGSADLEAARPRLAPAVPDRMPALSS